jgi:hypothetical protein
VGNKRTGETATKKASEINGDPVSADVSHNADASDSRFGVSDPHPKNGNNINAVSDVSDVSHLSEAKRVCVQCRGRIDGTEEEFVIDGHVVRLHSQCERFWRQGNWWGDDERNRRSQRET